MLSGFDGHEVRALIRATAPPETMSTPFELTGTLHDVTGGNPPFLREPLRELDEQAVKVGTAPGPPRTPPPRAPARVRPPGLRMSRPPRRAFTVPRDTQAFVQNLQRALES